MRDWREKAACIGNWPESMEEQRPICDGCYVRVPCLDDALLHQTRLKDVWKYEECELRGGLTPSERDAEIKRRAA